MARPRRLFSYAPQGTGSPLPHVLLLGDYNPWVAMPSRVMTALSPDGTGRLSRNSTRPAATVCARYSSSLLVSVTDALPRLSHSAFVISGGVGTPNLSAIRITSSLVISLPYTPMRVYCQSLL